MMTSLCRTPHRRRLFAGVAAAAALTFVGPVNAWAHTDDTLDQSIDSGQAVAEGQAVLDKGHVDIGPRFIDGEWTLLIHDDVAKADPTQPSVWRTPDDTVLKVTDASILPVPDDPAYAFLGVDAGASVSVIPQTQNSEVVWVGWNTQDPDVMDTIDRGVTLSLIGVDGPGEMVVYLQSGTFGEPETLWDSRDSAPQDVWVDVNTHTHANWVFTEPGVYLAQYQITADLVDGTSVTDTQSLRFAVGDSTDPAAAFAASASSVAPAVDESVADDSADAPSASSITPEGSFVGLLVGAIVVVAGLLVAGVSWAVVRGNRAKRRALSLRDNR
jgi:surface-anchored protein